MRHAKRRTARRDVSRLRPRLGPQSVIHRRHRDRTPGLDRQMQKGDGIPAARNRQPQLLPTRVAQRLPEDMPDVPGQEQPSPAIADAASPASAEPGNRVPTSCSVTQASGVCPRAPSACPSFNRAGAACGPEG